MNIKAERREKIKKNNSKMIISNRGIFTLVRIINDRITNKARTMIK